MPNPGQQKRRAHPILPTVFRAIVKKYWANIELGMFQKLRLKRVFGLKSSLDGLPRLSGRCAYGREEGSSLTYVGICFVNRRKRYSERA